MKRLIYKGKNRCEEFLSAAKIISKKIAKIEGVVGILATGGIGRGFCDSYSDLDLIIYADERNIKEIEKYIAVGNLRYKGIELDTPVESYQRALSQKSPSRYWSQVMRWDRQNSKILFDKGHKIKNLLQEKLVFPEEEQKKLLKEHGEEVEILLKYDFEMWQKRGKVINLADLLQRVVEHILLWIYAKNKKFQPGLPKWPFFYLENKLVPEAKHFPVIKKVYLEPIRTVSQAKKIKEELVKLSQNIGIKFQYDTIDDLFTHHRKNWEKAKEKTKYYLSW
jgi:hypothetical protein